MFGDKYLKKIEKIPFSNNTVERRIYEMSQWVKDILIKRILSNNTHKLT